MSYAKRQWESISAGLRYLETLGTPELSAQHDVIYVGIEGTQLSADDEILSGLSAWHWEYEYGCWAVFT